MYICVGPDQSNGAPLVRRNTSRSARYEAQEPGNQGETDIKRPPDSEIPDVDSDRPDAPNSPGAPPFTGEDVEDTGRPRKPDPPPVM